MGIKLYDKEFIRELAEKTGLSEEYIKNNEQKRDVGNSLNIYINSDAYGVENAADMICNIVKNVNENVNCN